MNAISPAERLPDRVGVRLDRLLNAAADGDEDAFVCLLDACDRQLRRLAATLVGAGTGEQLLPEVWRTALERWSAGTADPQTVRVWLCTIVTELARARGVILGARPDLPAVLPEQRFLPAGHRWAGHWADPPAPWMEATSGPAAAAAVRGALGALPSVAARAVTILRDVDGFSAADVARILDIDEAAERRLLHYGRGAVREALERVLAPA